MYCTKCGLKLGVNDKFCCRCGKAVNPNTTPQNTQPLPQPNSQQLINSKPISNACAPSINYKDIFNPDPSYRIYSLRIDAYNKLFKVGLFGAIHSFSDIIDVQIYENGQSISKTNTGSMVGRAVIGGMINPLGAAVGAVTAKKQNIEVIDSINVIITIKDLKKPMLVIPVLIHKAKKNSIAYSTAIQNAKEIESKINVLRTL